MHRAIALVLTVFCSLAAYAADEITCTGVWSPDTSEKKLIAQFGAANVTRGTIHVAEGDTTPGTILFPNDAKRRVEIVWRDTKKRQTPEWLRIPADSEWKTFSGIHVGSKLEEIEKLNGAPFTLNGFGWDYGGIVTDWRGGKLATAGGKCHMQLSFDIKTPENPPKIMQRAIDGVSGDRELSSSDTKMRMVRPFVAMIVISYPE
ncbi:MAG: hypothetical protein M3Q69_21395 [Acidobacteriota bacterium]|nr:hypothetical protein [Acidobacteriota bacterium]